MKIRFSTGLFSSNKMSVSFKCLTWLKCLIEMVITSPPSALSCSEPAF